MDVKASNVTVSEAGDLQIPAEIRSWRIRVTDLTGIPAPLAKVRYVSPTGRVLEMSADAFGQVATPPLPPKGCLEASQIGGSRAEVGATQLKTSFSPYTVALLAAVGSLAYFFRGVLRRKIL